MTWPGKEATTNQASTPRGEAPGVLLQVEPNVYVLCPAGADPAVVQRQWQERALRNARSQRLTNFTLALLQSHTGDLVAQGLDDRGEAAAAGAIRAVQMLEKCERGGSA